MFDTCRHTSSHCLRELLVRWSVKATSQPINTKLAQAWCARLILRSAVSQSGNTHGFIRCKLPIVVYRSAWIVSLEARRLGDHSAMSISAR